MVRRVSGQDLSIAMRQIATMFRAGIPLARALRVVGEGTPGVAGDIFRTMAGQVESGASLSKAMARHPQAFDGVFVRLIESGEVSGKMESVLAKVADLLEKSVRLRKKVVSSLAYPFVLGATALGTLGVFVFYVLPLMQPVFTSLGVELPLATRIVLGLASVVTNPWIAGPLSVLVLSLSAAGYVAFRVLDRSPSFRYSLHGALLRIPVLGPLLKKSTISRVLFTLSTLLDSGVSLGPALSVVEKVSGNEVLAQGLAQARKAMVAGAGVHDSLKFAEIFPDMVLHLIKAGEESGTLEMMMRRVSVIYEEEVDLALGALATSLEPLIMLGMGLVVAYVTVAAFLPMVKLVAEI